MSQTQGPTTRRWRTLGVSKRMIPHLLVFVYCALWMGERGSAVRRRSPSHNNGYDVYLVAVLQRSLQAV